MPAVRIGMPPARLGLVYSHTGLRKFLDAIGAPRTRELFFTARNVGAAEALGWGLVGEVVPAAEVAARGVELAAEIAANAPLSLAGNKRVIHELLAAEGPLDAAVEAELVALRDACFRSEDFFQGVRAFAEATAALARPLRIARQTGAVRRLVLALLVLLVPVPAAHAMTIDGPPDVVTAPAVDPPIAWRESRALGKPFAGRLLDGVQLPAEGRDFWTYDWGTRGSPNRPWRRWGTDRLVRTVLDVIGEYRAANPGAPRVGIADLSRTRGGPFGENFGGLGHASHQNGLDVDILYPRVDWLELHPQSPAVVDRELSQELVDRFVGAGAVHVFTGPRLGLRGPRKVVVKLRHHDDHLHVRIR